MVGPGRGGTGAGVGVETEVEGEERQPGKGQEGGDSGGPAPAQTADAEGIKADTGENGEVHDDDEGEAARGAGAVESAYLAEAVVKAGGTVGALGEQPGQDGDDGENPDDTADRAPKESEDTEGERQGAEVEGGLPAIPGAPELLAGPEYPGEKELHGGDGKDSEAGSLDFGEGDAAQGLGD